MNENKVELNEIIRVIKPTKNSYFLDSHTSKGLEDMFADE